MNDKQINYFAQIVKDWLDGISVPTDVPVMAITYCMDELLNRKMCCKDCKYGEKANAVYLCGKPRGFGAAHEPDWFCADGERKEGR